MTQKSKGFHVTTNTTIVVEATNALISSVYCCCTSAGSSWVMKITDSATPAKVLINLSIGAPFTDAIFDLKDKARMDSGIKIVTSGTTPGVIDVWINWFA